MSRSIEEDDLQAWVDGRLTPEDGEAVETYFAAHPELRKRCSQYARQREELRAALAGPAEEPIPHRLRVARLIAEQRRGRHGHLALITAPVALLLAGGTGGWVTHDLLSGLSSPASGVLASTAFGDVIAGHLTFSAETRHPAEGAANEEAISCSGCSSVLGTG